jgi:hypothetical protein
VRCGQIQSIRVGNKIRIPKESVASFIHSSQD